MINFRNFYFLAEVQQIGYQDVEQNKLFGPVYHGTTEENMSKILQTGFRSQSTLPRTGETRHGYEFSDYSGGIPMPIHHLGFGTYFTTVKNIAIDYNQGSSKGLKAFFLNVPRFETINFGSPNTMMKWWRIHGYDMPSISTLKEKSQQEIDAMWISATQKLTDNLKSQFDAVWFKGKGIRRLLDGDQICVYDPSKIYLLNKELNLKDSYLVGDRVKIKNVPVAASIVSKRSSSLINSIDKLLNYKSQFVYNVKISSADVEKIKSFYEESLIEFLLKDKNFEDLMQTRIANGQTFEEATKDYVNYILSPSSLKMNFPESLFEKKLNRGERATK